MDVACKHISAIRLHRKRKPYASLDAAPFAAVYVALVATALAQAHAVWPEASTPAVVAAAIAAAFTAHVLLALLCVWIPSVKAIVQYESARDVNNADAVRVKPAAFHGRETIVPLKRTPIFLGGNQGDKIYPGTDFTTDGEDQLSHTFEYRKQRFYLDTTTHTFRKLEFNFHQPPNKLVAAHGRGYGTDAKANAAKSVWGANVFDVPRPEFRQLLINQMMQPFFVFQVFCVALWLLDAYWYYALFTLVMLVFFECTVVYQRQRTSDMLRRDVGESQNSLPVSVYRGGKWAPVPRSELLPGDVISLRSIDAREQAVLGVPAVDVPADCLLLGGVAVASEAMLTGESTPQWKSPVHERVCTAKEGDDEPLRRSRDKRHILFKGTTLVKHERPGSSSSAEGGGAKVPRPPDGGCVCLVMRTGFGTSQGKLMRSMLFSHERVSANSAEAGLFILVLLGIAVVAASYVLYDWTIAPNGRSLSKVMLMVMIILTSVVPPELPMELSLAVNQSLVELIKSGIFCTEPFRIPFAGKCDTCCFDKTGTLTSESLVLHGVVATDDFVKNRLVANLSDASAQCCRVLGVCHALTDASVDQGDPLDLAGFAAVRARFVSRDRVQPCNLPRPAEGASAPCRILRRFHFASELRRMSVICRVNSPGDRGSNSGVGGDILSALGGGSDERDELWVLAKGAPETIETLLEHVPDGYVACHQAWAKKGARVIALAARRIADAEEADDVLRVPREKAETNLHLVGLAIFECPLKTDSAACLAHLANSKHQLVMITGDAPLAACHVAKQCGILSASKTLLLDLLPSQGSTPATAESSSTAICWQALDDSQPDKATSLAYQGAAQCSQLARDNIDLCVSGAAITELERRGEANDALVHMRVLARTNPRQKALMIAALRAQGRTCLMCGDGTNDVGALRDSQVGVALLGGPSPAAVSPAGASKGGKGGQRRIKGAPPPPGEPDSGDGGGKGRRRIKGAPPPPGEPDDDDSMAVSGSHTALDTGGDGALEDDADSKSWIERIQEQQRAEEQLSLGVSLRDASLASPFTVRGSSIRPCLDIIRQGRTTLVATLQMFKILGLQCLCGAYSMSVMYIQGVRLGDSQATFSGIFSAALFFCLSQAKPLDKLSPERPHTRVFSTYILVSMVLQFAAHLSFTIYATQRALTLRPEGEEVCVAFDLEGGSEAASSSFETNVVNSVCYIVNLYTLATNFAVNYVGHPHSTPIHANRPMLFAVLAMMATATLLSVGESPVNELLEVSASLPGTLGTELVAFAAADFAFCWCVENALRKLPSS